MLPSHVQQNIPNIQNTTEIYSRSPDQENVTHSREKGDWQKLTLLR